MWINTSFTKQWILAHGADTHLSWVTTPRGIESRKEILSAQFSSWRPLVQNHGIRCQLMNGVIRVATCAVLGFPTYNLPTYDPGTGNQTRALRDSGTAWCRWHGRSLSRPRSASGSRG